jgi:membrane-bound serine protease (ClpP class)
MSLVILLFAVGILLLLIEVIMPGAVIGTIGALMLFGGCVKAFIEFGALGGSLAIAIAFACAVLALFIEFRFLPRTKIGRRAFLTSQVTGVSAAVGKDAQALVGKSAEAVTMLSPSGYVRVEGKRYEAFCQSGQVPAGTTLEVIGADNFRLIVSPIKSIL